MKKLLTIMITLILILGVGACSKQVPANPKIEMTSKDDLVAQTGCPMNFPEAEATDIVYSTVLEVITQIEYTHKNNVYVYRACKYLSGPSDLGGIYDDATSTKEEGDYILYSYAEGYQATWTIGEVNYSLYSKTTNEQAFVEEIACTKTEGAASIENSISNPITSHDSIDALYEATGIDLSFINLDDVDSISYNDIGGTTAEIRFTLAGNEYCLRASLEASGYNALAGYYYEPSSETEAAPATIYEFNEVNALIACWSSGGINYSLVSEGNDFDTFSNNLQRFVY